MQNQIVILPARKQAEDEWGHEKYAERLHNLTLDHVKEKLEEQGFVVQFEEE